MNKIILTIIALSVITIIYFNFSKNTDLTTQLTEKNTNNNYNRPTQITEYKKPDSNKKNRYLQEKNSKDTFSSIDELMSEELLGNPSAAYQITVLHRKCANIPDKLPLLDQQISKIKDLLLKKNLIQNFQDCEGFPRNSISQNELREKVIYAARQGNLKAKLEFPAFAFMGFDSENALKNIELLSSLKSEAYQHLVDVKQAGEQSALFALGTAFEDGDLVAQDYIEAYAYYYAYSELNQGSSTALLENIESELTDTEVFKAIKRGEKYVKCCI